MDDTYLANTNLNSADLFFANLLNAQSIDQSNASPIYYSNTTLPVAFAPVAQGWPLAPYCAFTPDGTCNLADIQQMLQTGDLQVGVATSVSTDRFD